MNKSGQGRCSGDKRWIKTLNLSPLTDISDFYPIRSRLTSDLIPVVSTGIRTPPEASIPESHPTSVSLRQTVKLSQRNKTQLVTSQFIRMFKRILQKQSVNQKITLLRAAQSSGVICIRRWQAQSFILCHFCFILLGFVLKGKAFIFQRCKKSRYSA